MRKILGVLMVIALMLSLLSGCGQDEKANKAEESKGTICLATTTSTKDSGLLEYLLPAFTKETGWDVDVVSVGSGEAMTMGEKGEADVLLVHSPKDEEDFVAAGNADQDGRKDVMYNDYVIIGPKEDMAKVKKDAGDNAIAAFKIIAGTKSKFVSRADESGTHKKELSIWEKVGIKPSGDWYIEAADGMGAVITMTDEKLGYTLSDRATWLTFSKKTDLGIVCEKDPSGLLNNQYGVICVNPDINAQINKEGAKAFQEWITSASAQELIGTFGKEEFGTALFVPNANR